MVGATDEVWVRMKGGSWLEGGLRGASAGRRRHGGHVARKGFEGWGWSGGPAGGATVDAQMGRRRGPVVLVVDGAEEWRQRCEAYSGGLGSQVCGGCPGAGPGFRTNKRFAGRFARWTGMLSGGGQRALANLPIFRAISEKLLSKSMASFW